MFVCLFVFSVKQWFGYYFMNLKSRQRSFNFPFWPDFFHNTKTFLTSHKSFLSLHIFLFISKLSSIYQQILCFPAYGLTSALQEVFHFIPRWKVYILFLCHMDLPKLCTSLRTNMSFQSVTEPKFCLL